MITCLQRSYFQNTELTFKLTQYFEKLHGSLADSATGGAYQGMTEKLNGFGVNDVASRATAIAVCIYCRVFKSNSYNLCVMYCRCFDGLSMSEHAGIH